MDLGIIMKVAGRQMQQDFEPVLERQVHYFVNGASGIQHVGQRDIAWIRISNAAADKGFSLESFGKILHARFHEDFGAIVDKVQVTIVTEPALHAEWLEKARVAYDFRNKRLADLTDNKVEEFYSCTLCQSFAPNHVCVVSPERLGLCGAYNWLDCKASFSINPTGPNLLEVTRGEGAGRLYYRAALQISQPVEEVAAASGRLTTLVFGSGDYAASMRMPLVNIGMPDEFDAAVPGTAAKRRASSTGFCAVGSSSL